MRTTVNLDDALLESAKEYSGIERTPELLNHVLTKFIQGEAARRLAKLGGTMPDFEAAPRKRYWD